MILRGLLAAYTEAPAKVCCILERRTRLIFAVRIARPKLLPLGCWEGLAVDCVIGDYFLSARRSCR